MTGPSGPPDVISGRANDRTILLVMQDPEELSAMDLALGRAGYGAVLAMDARHALRSLEGILTTPVGVMLDARIPRAALTDLVQAIAQRPNFAQVPILFIKQNRPGAQLN